MKIVASFLVIEIVDDKDLKWESALSNDYPSLDEVADTNVSQPTLYQYSVG
jgi:hypothetical protein